MAFEGAPAEEQRIGEAHLYTVPGKVTLRPGQTSIVALFEPTTAPVAKRLVVQSGLPYWGGLQQYGDAQDVPVSVTYVVTRALKTPFGDTPVPGGAARIYQADAAGRLQLIGESAIGHTAAGQPLELGAGTAFDLTARRTQTTYSQRAGQERPVHRHRRLQRDRGERDRLRRHRGRARGAGRRLVGASRVLATADRVSSTRVRFRLSVPAKGEITLTYRVRVTW